MSFPVPSKAQSKEMVNTDLVSRYRDYANEKVCKADYQEGVAGVDSSI